MIATREPQTKPRLFIRDSKSSGRPVVMIHGFPLSSDAFESQFTAFENAGLRTVAYDRRGFGRSEKPSAGFDYDTLADDLANVLETLDLREVLLLGFSMGGGEVARYVSRHGEDRIAGLVFAAAVPPFLLKSLDNPKGPLDQSKADEKLKALIDDREKYFEAFVKKFYEVEGRVVVDDRVLQKAISLCKQSDQTAAIGCMKAFSSTDFRNDLRRITVPTLVIHGDADAVVPIEGSGLRTVEMVESSQLTIIKDGPHGINDSHADEFNNAVIDFSSSLS